MSAPGRVLVYGATGYSGTLAVEALRHLGIAPIVAGRDVAKTERLAAALGAPYRTARADDPSAVTAMLDDVAVVLNAAGPFSATAEPIADACLERGAHYLDLCAEVSVLERLAARHAAARARGVMLMPAVGFDVVPTDCLAAHLARRVRRARALTIAVSRPFFLSPGSAKTLLENVVLGVARRDGALRPLRLGSVERAFDLGPHPVACLNVSAADLVTAYHTTGIREITTFVEATPLLRLLPLGPLCAPWLRTPVGAALGRALSDVLWGTPPRGADSATWRMACVAEIEDGRGGRARARLTTPEAYAFTGATAGAIAARVARGDVEAGFQTPGRVFGPDLVLGFADVAREDLE
ncbi:MAG: saccharopine dehydrogenase NADP-binding domain-containing protein [Deltaproteobacteria bacterium]|nr:saccharopine dehydrogenase NADP-binding domain-containing protein [Deltaproteobacteria bacterium]